jgi:acetyl-CoA carboxylase beta subunit
MRRDQRHHDAAKIKEINQVTFKDKDKEWVKCSACKMWLWEETYFKVDWYVGPVEYYPHSYSLSYGHGNPTFRFCTACCNSTLAVVDYLDELKEKNAASYEKSYKAWLKTEKKKEKEALTIVDGKNYSFTFKEVEEN